MAKFGEFGSAPEWAKKGFQSVEVVVGTKEQISLQYPSDDVVLVEGGMFFDSDDWEFLVMRREPQEQAPGTSNPEVKLCWLDLETGGLDGLTDNGQMGAQRYPILEIGIIVTDAELNEIGEGMQVVVHHDQAVLDEMDPWAIEQHTKSGLLQQVLDSKISLEQAEQMCLDYLAQCGALPYDRKAKTGTIMAGNSIKFDRNYLDAQMPALSGHFHYRQLDVSAFNLACRLWAPQVSNSINKQYKHLALDDIRESVAEARIYKSLLF